MTNEEEKLKNIVPGTENPFRVPEGYFDQLPDTIMERIHSQKRPRQSIWHRWAIAAAFVGMVSGVSVVLYNGGGTTENKVATTVQQTNTVNNEALDYAMVDNSEIEYYLTNE